MILSTDHLKKCTRRIIGFTDMSTVNEWANVGDIAWSRYVSFHVPSFFLASGTPSHFPPQPPVLRACPATMHFCEVKVIRPRAPCCFLAQLYIGWKSLEARDTLLTNKWGNWGLTKITDRLVTEMCSDIPQAMWPPMFQFGGVQVGIPTSAISVHLSLCNI